MELLLTLKLQAVPAVRPHFCRRLSHVHSPVDRFDPTRAIMDSFGRLKSDLRRVGMPLDEFDLLIACTALTHGLTLVTNNTRHVDRVPGLRLANWAGG